MVGTVQMCVVLYWKYMRTRVSLSEAVIVIDGYLSGIPVKC